MPAEPYTYRVNTAAAGADPDYVMVERIMVRVRSDYANLNEEKTMFMDGDTSDTDDINTLLNAASTGIGRAAGRVYSIGTCDADESTTTTDDDCINVPAYSRTTSTTTSDAGTPGLTVTAAEETFYAEAERQGENTEARIDSETTTTTTTTTTTETVLSERKDTSTEYGHKNTHVAIEFNVGGVTPYLGHSTKKMNGAMGKKTKTTHYGVSGGLGDTGINFLVAARSVDDGGTKTSPWLFNVSKNLGGGATVIFEHANYDSAAPGDKETAIGLHVSF